MTPIDRFDPFEQRITAAIDEIAAPRRPDYLDDLLRQTARTRQRPRWSFIGRWLPMDTTLAPVSGTARFPVRATLLLIAALLLAVAAAIAVVGAANRTAPPFGLAGNGQLAYAQGGDLWVADGPGVNPRVLVAAGDIRGGISFSPDGRLIAYPVTEPGGDRFWVVGADGSNPHPIHDDLISEGWAWAAWSPDSSTFAMAGTIGGRWALVLAAADGSGDRSVPMDGYRPWDVGFNPRDPDQMLLRLQETQGIRALDLYVADADGTGLRPLRLRTGPRAFGDTYTLSGSAWSPGADVIAYNGIDTDPETLITRFRVHLVNADGTGDRALPGPDDPNIQEAWPTWSPDGRWLIVQRWRWRDSGDKGDGWMAIMPGDGSEPARDIGPRLTEGDGTNVVKAWSPDGTKVLMELETGEVYLVDPFADTWERLPGTSLLPDWQRTAP